MAPIIRLRPRWLTRTLTGKRRAVDTIEADLLVIRMLGDGCSYAEIAKHTGRAEATIRAIIEHAKRRSGARTTPQFFRMATEAGLFESVKDDAEAAA